MTNVYSCDYYSKMKMISADNIEHAAIKYSDIIAKLQYGKHAHSKIIEIIYHDDSTDVNVQASIGIKYKNKLRNDINEEIWYILRQF